MANYDDWKDAVNQLLRDDFYNGEAATANFWMDQYRDGMKPEQAVEQYMKWLDGDID